METAYLSNYDDYTTFEYRNRVITFLTGNRLNRYIRVKKWSKGYLVVDCENRDKSVEEDYIDLVPILKNLYMDPEVFLRDIKEVKIGNVNR